MVKFIDFIKIPEESKAKVKFNMRHKISGERALDLLRGCTRLAGMLIYENEAKLL